MGYYNKQEGIVIMGNPAFYFTIYLEGLRGKEGGGGVKFAPHFSQIC